MPVEYTRTNWWEYLGEDLQELVRQSFHLIEEAVFKKVDFRDYGYVVFPMAKAYEGFLKKLFFELNLITKQQYYGEHFRIGRALNPNLPIRYRSDWVYGKLSDYCKGETLPTKLWETWKRGRNRVFHYFPHEAEFLTLDNAKEVVSDFAEAMAFALAGCKLDQS